MCDTCSEASMARIVEYSNIQDSDVLKRFFDARLFLRGKSQIPKLELNMPY